MSGPPLSELGGPRPLLRPWVRSVAPAAHGSWRRAPGPELLRQAARRLLLEQAAAYRDAGQPCPFEHTADFRQAASGAPESHGAWHWAVSHTAGWCAALLAPLGPLGPPGLDLELAHRPVSPALAERLARLAPGTHEAPLERWLRVEALAKLSGEGLALLAKIHGPVDLSDGLQRWSFDGRLALTRLQRLGGLWLGCALRVPFELAPWCPPHSQAPAPPEPPCP